MTSRPRALLRSVPLICSCLAIALALAAPRAVHAAADPKGVVKCQATLEKAGAKFVGKKAGALAKCSDGVFKCIQTVDESGDAGVKRTTCITKARGGCLKALAAVTAARQAFVAAAAAACGALDPAQVTGADGLGYGDTDCSEFGVSVTSVATLVDCLARQHGCLVSRNFQLAMPRVLELLQFTPPDAVAVPAADVEGVGCLEEKGGTGADVNDLVLGKGIVKCEKAIEKVEAKLVSGGLKAVQKCVGALFACEQTKTGDDLTKCRDKARAGCEKGLGKSTEQRAALVATLGKPCGDATLFAALRTPAGANLDANVPSMVARGSVVAPCTVFTTLTDFQACLAAEAADLIDDLVRFQAPRTESLLGTVGCSLDGCGAPVPTPTPVATPNGTPGITQIIDATGDGAGHALGSALGIGVDTNGAVYVAGQTSHNVFKIAPGGSITQIIDASGDGQGHGLDQPSVLAVKGTTVYVTGTQSDNVFKITAGGVVTQILDASGDGAGHPVNFPNGLAVGADDSVYVSSQSSDSVFKIASGGTVTRILSSTGDGVHPLDDPAGIAVDAQNTVYVSSFGTNDVFKVTSGGAVTRILTASGDGQGHTCEEPADLTLDGTTAYVSCASTDNVFKITAGGQVTQVMNKNSDPPGEISTPTGLVVDDLHNLYVTWSSTARVFKVTPSGTITRLMTNSGDGAGHTLSFPFGVAVDPQRNVFVSGYNSNNAFKIVP